MVARPEQATTSHTELPKTRIAVSPSEHWRTRENKGEQGEGTRPGRTATCLPSQPLKSDFLTVHGECRAVQGQNARCLWSLDLDVGGAVERRGGHA